MFTKRMICQLTVALMLVLAVGCQNSAAPSSESMAAPPHALVVNYPNGGGTTVFLPPPAGSTEPMMLSTTGTDACPECKAAAIKYFQTGVLDPKCSRTGATRSVTNFVIPSHN